MSARLGTFRVKAEPEEVAAFRKATKLDVDGIILPLTYPMRWLVTPEIRTALLAMASEPDLILVHESQSFAYQRPLCSGQDYTLTLSARREPVPDRLFVDGVITDDDGGHCASVETILRLFSMGALAA